MAFLKLMPRSFTRVTDEIHKISQDRRQVSRNSIPTPPEHRRCVLFIKDVDRWYYTESLTPRIIIEQWQNDTDGGKLTCSDKQHITAPLCPQQPPRGLDCDWSRVDAVRERWLNSCYMLLSYDAVNKTWRTLIITFVSPDKFHVV